MFNDLHIQTGMRQNSSTLSCFNTPNGKRASTDSIAKWCIKFVYMKNRNEWGIATAISSKTHSWTTSKASIANRCLEFSRSSCLPTSPNRKCSPHEHGDVQRHKKSANQVKIRKRVSARRPACASSACACRGNKKKQSKGNSLWIGHAPVVSHPSVLHALPIKPHP